MKPRRAAFGTMLAASVTTALAQPDAPLPPRLPDTTDIPDTGPPSGRPGETRLADVAPERSAALDEIVVIGDQPLRLPDLGSSLRQQRERERRGRIAVALPPLYDPLDPLRMQGSAFPLNEELRRVGFLELFRIQFGGRRSPDTPDGTGR